MPPKAQPNRIGRPAKINPDFVDIGSNKPKPGRPITVTATFPNPHTKVLETCSLTLFPEVAANIQQNLLERVQDAVRCRSGDLEDESVIGQLLAVAMESVPKSKRQWMKPTLRACVEEDAPWIHWFALRVSTEKTLPEKFKDLLEKILSEATLAGYPETVFQGTHRPTPYLYSTLAAFLVEHCTGGANMWTDLKCTPPVKLIRQSLSRQRAQRAHQTPPDPIGGKNIFKEVLGKDYKAFLAVPEGKIPLAPPAIQRLINPSRKSISLSRSHQ